MTNFADELEALILEWLKRGDDPGSMGVACCNSAAELFKMESSAEQLDKLTNTGETR